MLLSVLGTFIVAFIAAFVVATPASAQGDGAPDFLVLKTSTDRVSYAPGDTAQVTIEMTLDPTIHINAHVPTEDYQYPTDITWTPVAGLEIGTIAWPKPLI